MAIINFLRFSEHSGAILSDEESWRLRMRRTFYFDNIHSLLNKDQSDALGMEAIYAGIGTQSFHFEVIDKCTKKIEQNYKDKNIRNVEDIAKLVLDVMHEVQRRRIDDKLRFLFGFETDDLNKGNFEKNGTKYDIKQSVVKERARKIASGKEKDRMVRKDYENHAIVAGYDKMNGFIGFCLKADIPVLSMISGGFDSLGSGKYGGGFAFAEFLNQKTLRERYAGFDRNEGMIELIKSGLYSKYYGEVGGYFNIVYIDGMEDNHEKRFKEFCHHKVHLASEIVRALKLQIINEKSAKELINDIFFSNKDVEEVDRDLFNSVDENNILKFMLRGYKFDEELKKGKPPAKPGKISRN